MALTPDEIYNPTQTLSQECVFGYIMVTLYIYFYHVLSSRLIASNSKLSKALLPSLLQVCGIKNTTDQRPPYENK